MQGQSKNRSEHVVVEPIHAQYAIHTLKKSGIYDTSRKVFHREGLVYIPVNGKVENFKTILAEGVTNERWRYPHKYTGSYAVIGDIAIIHFRKGIDPSDLAERILERKNGIRSVYLDRGIKGEERLRSVEFLAGTDDPVTLHKENGIVLKVNISNVYFSPRLATERMRILRKSRDGENIVDMFAGVGPFSILLAKNLSVTVTSMDINRHAIDLLRENISLNRLKGKIIPVMGDSSVLMDDIHDADRIIMNLPHGSMSFIGKASSALKNGGSIHYYEICTPRDMEERMETFRRMCFSVEGKREVHGYSPQEIMYALDLRKDMATCYKNEEKEK